VLTGGKIIRPTVLAAGYKGALFVTGLLEAGIQPLRIVSYRQEGDESDSFDRLRELGRKYEVCVEEGRHPRLDQDALVFLVGWQFLLREGLDRCVVLHDSLLPHLRGFSPTVTALILGVETIGVTAIRPDNGLDSGPICGTRDIRVSPGANLHAVLELQSRAMIDLALEILQKTSDGTLVEKPQSLAQATFSLWRDSYDYFIDWRRGAPEILRHVNALGFPYEGAKGIINDQVVTIQRASLGSDFVFAIRDPGKLWQVDDRRALVVCGSGMLWIEDAFDASGGPFHFKYLRSRFLTADTAWIAPYLRIQDHRT
jgi:methionyl-tRNA formyltransferase